MREENRNWQERDRENLSGRALRREQERKVAAWNREQARLRSEEEIRERARERERLVSIERFQDALENL
jgi:hypothetical protein